MRIIGLLKKLKSIILYGIFGVLTTLVNIFVYWIVAHRIGFKTVPSSVIAWVAAVSFAYITNRRWVFGSDASTASEITREAFRFFLCRLATGFLDWIFMFVTVDVAGLNDVYMKVIANIIVIVVNYIASRLVIFGHDIESE